MIVRKIKVNEYEYQPPINYVAGATEPDIQFQITDYVIPSGAEARAFVQRFDGTFEYTVATIDDQNITIEPTSSMFSVKGEGAIQVTLYVGDEVVKNFSVPVFVHADLADDAAQEGRDIVSIFHESEQAALEQFREDAEEIAEEVIESIPSDYTELSETVDELNERLTAVEAGGAGMSDAAKYALLACLERVAWVSDDGQDYFDALETALFPEARLESISAVYTPTLNVYDDWSVEGLRDYLVVKAHYDIAPAETITAYTLEGTLSVGTSTITVRYGGKSTTFEVVVSAPLYSFTEGTHNFTNPAATVQCIGSNRSVLTASTANQNDIHANMSNVSANTSACNSTNNYLNGGNNFFTIPAGSTVHTKMIVNSIANWNTTTFLTSFFKADDGSEPTIANSTYQQDITPGMSIEKTIEVENATPVRCIGMYLGNRRAKIAASVDVSYIIYVDDVRYI